jgi:hypothetical protein
VLTPEPETPRPSRQKPTRPRRAPAVIADQQPLTPRPAPLAGQPGHQDPQVHGPSASDLWQSDPWHGDPWHVVSWGLGVDSSAYLTEILDNSDRHSLDLDRLIVVHAVVGDEWSTSLTYAQRYLLPPLRDRGVRTVQVARAGPRDAQGIVVLDDSTRPRRVHRRGPWTLADESRLSGTVPQLSHRRCSLKFKGWVLDTWLRMHLDGRPLDHVIGYSADEMRRAQRDLVYATATRRPVHPLIDWGWTRAACSARLLTAYDVVWPKSACVFCPYSGGASLLATLARMRAHPDEAATALMLEAPALALNPRSKLYGRHSLANRLTEDGNTTALDIFHQRLYEQSWTVYDVRRIHLPQRGDPTRRGTSWRAVTPLHTTDPAQAVEWLDSHTAGEADADHRIWLHPSSSHRASQRLYPQVEHFRVATVAGIAAKARPGFAELWQRVAGDQPALFPAGDLRTSLA